MLTVREVLEKYGIYYEEDESSGELLILCPFHDDHNVGSAFFNEDDDKYYCFSCSRGGSIYDFVMRLEDCDYQKAKEILKDGIDYKALADVEVKTVQIAKPFDPNFKKNQRNLVDALAFLILRRLSDRAHDGPFVSRWVSVLTYVYSHYLDPIVVFDKNIRVFYKEFVRELESNKK
jgi:hypothetical protein